jgi:hypothetical protein
MSVFEFFTFWTSHKPYSQLWRTQFASVIQNCETYLPAEGEDKQAAKLVHVAL